MDVSMVESCETYFWFNDLVRDTQVYIGRKLVVGPTSQSHYQYLIWIPEDIKHIPEKLTYWSLSGLDFLIRTASCPAMFSSRKARKRYKSYIKALHK